MAEAYALEAFDIKKKNWFTGEIRQLGDLREQAEDGIQDDLTCDNLNTFIAYLM